MEEKKIKKFDIIPFEDLEKRGWEFKRYFGIDKSWPIMVHPEEGTIIFDKDKNLVKAIY